MKKNIFAILALLIIAASAFAFIQSQNWKIGNDYSIKFSGHNASGIFKGLKGTISFDATDLAASKFDVSIDVSTINTGNGMKNTHAKSDKWFDVNKYQTISFYSSSITKASASYEAKGKLTMHGKPTIDFILTTPFYRYYVQTAAKYFAAYKEHSPTDQYYTSNYALAAFSSQSFGMGIRLAPPKGVLIKSLSALELRYSHYTQTTDLSADMISLNLKLK